MGAIRKAIESFDSSSELGQAQREIVENLAKLAEAKAEFFDLEVQTSLRTAGSSDNLTVPVEAVLNSITQTHAYSSDSPAKIGDTVANALKSFMSGSKDEILNGVSGLITDALTTFLGSAEASTGTLKQYYVITEGFSIVRVDLRAWYLEVSAQGIKNKVQKASAFLAVKSTVDLGKVKFNTFLNLYQRQLASMKLNDLQIEGALDEAQRIYNKFPKSSLAADAVVRLAAMPATNI